MKVFEAKLVSMLSKDLFEKIEYLSRQFRGDERPFGGIQVIFVGDFYQLPPPQSEYCFQSDVWDLMTFKTISLNKVEPSF